MKRYVATLLLFLLVVVAPFIGANEFSGGGGGLVIGTSLITSGTDTRVLYDDAGKVGEDAGMTYNETTNTLSVGGGAQPDADVTNVTGDVSFFAGTGNITGLGLINVGANATGPNIYGFKTRNATGSANTVAVSGDSMLDIIGAMADGAAFLNGAMIRFYASDVVASNDAPGGISFWATLDGAASMTRVLNIDGSSASTGIVVAPFTDDATNLGGTANRFRDLYMSDRIDLGTDPADQASGFNLANATKILWEASAAGTDVGLWVDTGETLVIDTTGLEFTESDTNPACAAGNYNIFADLSETKLKKCTNGTATDLDTAAGGVFTATTGYTTWLLSTTSTEYIALSGKSQPNVTGDDLQSLIPPGNFSNFRCFVSAAPGAGKSRAITLYAGSNLVTCTIADTNTNCAQQAGPWNVAVDSYAYLTSVPTGTPAAAGLSCYVTFAAT